MAITTNWQTQRDEELRAIELRAIGLMVGKTIRDVAAVPHDPGCAGTNVLVVTFTDGSRVEIEGGYGGYSGHACDEYVEQIDVRSVR